MTTPPKLSKWPFFLGNFLLIGLAALIVARSPAPFSLNEGLVCMASVALGACLSVWPFLREYQAELKLRQVDALADAAGQFGNLEAIQSQIADATAQWQHIQQSASETVAGARELSAQMKAQMSEFTAFLQKASDVEKNHLRLELDKLRRSERDWLQAVVHILDHVFALHAAGTRSGQPALQAQLGQFQFACRDAARRLGLVSFAPVVQDPFDPQLHQLKDGAKAGEGLRVSEILAVGYTFQGELVRKALVTASSALPEPAPSAT